MGRGILQDESQINKLLAKAVCDGDVSGVRSALERGADSNLSIEGVTMLSAAALNADEEIVDLLLEHQVDVNKRDGNLFTPLGWMAIAGRTDAHYRIASRLIDSGANVDLEMPLTIISNSDRYMNRRMTQLLLDAGAEKDTPIVWPPAAARSL